MNGLKISPNNSFDRDAAKDAAPLNSIVEPVEKVSFSGECVTQGE